jgi:hypothetical protein
MNRLTLAVALAASLTLVSGAPVAADGRAASGVRGVLRLSHGCPGPVREGDTRRCDFAGAGIVVRAFRPAASAAVAADRTDRSGRFAIALPAGLYLLRAEVPKTRDQPLRVRVQPAKWTLVTLRYLVPPYME